jgi:glycerophosphoryl diester phosphodiesterase
MVVCRGILLFLTLFAGHLVLGNPLIVAHRGASFVAPENTLPAFELAWEQGADAIEGDFLLTKDNQIVCIHDKTTKRLTEQNLVVAESTLEQLKTLDVGSWKNKKYTGTQIPTISEVFATVPSGKKFFVEVKCGPEIIPYLIKEIKMSGLKMDQVRLICFDKEVIKVFKKRCLATKRTG